MTRSELMSRVKGKDSAAEQALRSALHAAGLRFRLHRRSEGLAVDIAFPTPRVAVFVDGCFWHGCPAHETFPKTNRDYWIPKLKENKERDLRQTQRLSAAGWEVFRVWEHDCFPPAPQVTTPVRTAAPAWQVVAAIVKACRSGGSLI